jgi:hypothetical protein
MEPKRGTSREDESGAGPGGRRSIVPASILLAVVVGLLVLGAVLQGGSTEPREPVGVWQQTEPAGPAAVEARPAEPPPAPELRAIPPEPASGSGTRDLERRVLADTLRLGHHARAWTLQLMVACDPENARKRLLAAGGAGEFFLLPVRLGGRSCFRACWGRYPTREAALAARDVPPALRLGLEAPPHVRAVTEVLP